MINVVLCVISLNNSHGYADESRYNNFQYKTLLHASQERWMYDYLA